jgi:hypothetical protein
MPKTMAHAVVDGVFLAVHSKSDPTDEEWQELLIFHKSKAPFSTRMLVVTEGGGPKPKHRAALNDYLKIKGAPMKVAVCTHSTVVRGIVTALNWFNDKVRAFPIDDLTPALEYLGAQPAEIPRIAAEVKKLRAMLLKGTG